jgi:hypothetical protein
MSEIDPFSKVPLAGHDMGFDTPTVDETASTKVAKWFDKQENIMKKKKGCKKCKDEKVDHPTHYNVGKIEVIDAIEDWKLGFNDGNAIKYIARHQRKSDPIQDIEKAIWYLERHLNILKANNEKL